jgi:16S rRNA processing protein RimM
VDKALLPDLIGNEYYWHQLVGLEVVSVLQDGTSRLGVVDSLLETGANDVLVIKGDFDSLDREERLIPYSNEFVKSIDLEKQIITVVWDPEF